VWIRHGYATGAAQGLTGADLPEHEYWQKWFPADWVSESREQIRLWFYSQCFMSVALTGQSPYRRVLAYERVRDETGREMHKSWGNAIEANEAFERIGADVMRLLYAAQVPSQNVNFGYGPANEVKRRFLTLWNSVSFFVTYANVEEFTPAYDDLVNGPPPGHALDAWVVARTRQLVAEATDAFDRYWTPAVARAFDAFVEDLSNWYIRRSRRRFYSFDEAAFRTLWYALVQSVRVIAPVIPFMADHLWRNLVAGVCEGAPDSVHLAGWPEVEEPDAELLAEIAEVRRVVELGRQARSQAGIKQRQPLRGAVVYGASNGTREHADEIASELRVRELVVAEGGGGGVRLKPNLPVLGPRLGPRLPELRRALEEGRWEWEDGRVRVEDQLLGEGEFLVERQAANEGFAFASDGELSVEIDPQLDDDLRREGRLNDLTHAVNVLRKERGLDVTDRIRLIVPEADADLVERYADRINEETLAVELEVGTELDLERA
jgi:isoleucyl-tRNA synthetase